VPPYVDKNVLDGSVPDLRGHLAGLLSGTVNSVQFQRWVGLNSLAIEIHGSDVDIDLLNLVDVRLAEYTSGYIDASSCSTHCETIPWSSTNSLPIAPP
jgi:hypothetical protein